MNYKKSYQKASGYTPVSKIGESTLKMLEFGIIELEDSVQMCTKPEMYEHMYAKAKEDEADIVICDIVEQFVDSSLYHSHTKASHKLGYANYVLNKILILLIFFIKIWLFTCIRDKVKYIRIYFNRL